ncbi:MAG: hypothetical protein ACR2K9_00290 [Solirubrobacteraceae bacterium]
MLKVFERDLDRGEDITLLGDPGRALYGAFGLERASFARVWLDPRVWLRYGSLLARGRRPRAAQGDTLQLGGNAILDARGTVRYVYRSRGPEDRPSVDELNAEREKMPAS